MARKKSEPARDRSAEPYSETPALLLSHEQVALRAYEKWSARGRPTGDDLRDWLEAEQELRREVRTAQDAALYA